MTPRDKIFRAVATREIDYEDLEEINEMEEHRKLFQYEYTGSDGKIRSALFTDWNQPFLVEVANKIYERQKRTEADYGVLKKLNLLIDGIKERYGELE
jgi:hypothetical protein